MYNSFLTFFSLSHGYGILTHAELAIRFSLASVRAGLSGACEKKIVFYLLCLSLLFFATHQDVRGGEDGAKGPHDDDGREDLAKKTVHFPHVHNFVFASVRSYFFSKKATAPPETA